MTAKLGGVRVLVTRPTPQAEALCAAVRDRGGEAEAVPLFEIDAIVVASADLPGLPAFDAAIFVSANAVRCLQALLFAQGIAWPDTLRSFAIGQATRDALAAQGIRAEAGCAAMDSEELLAHPALQRPAGQRILLLKGEGGRELLGSALRARGADVVEFALYRRRPVAYDAIALGQRLRAFGASALLVASGETLGLLLGLLRQMPAGTIPAGTPVIVPGERVAALARAAGLAPVVVAANASDAAMLDSLSTLAARAAPTVEH